MQSQFARRRKFRRPIWCAAPYSSLQSRARTASTCSSVAPSTWWFDGGEALRDSQAILFYLARTRGEGRWVADDALGQARTIAWLSFAANELANGPAALRVAVRFKRPVNTDWATAVTRRAFGLMQSVLSSQPWLMAGEHPSIADIACFPYTALAHEGNFSLADYPAVIAWCDRMRALPGFVGMDGV